MGGRAVTLAPISLSPFVCPLGRAELQRLSNTLQGLSSGQTRVLGRELPPMAWAPLVPGVCPALGQWQEGLTLGCFLAAWCVWGWGGGGEMGRTAAENILIQVSGCVAPRNLVLALGGGQGVATSKGVCRKESGGRASSGLGAGLPRQREG